MEDVVEDFADYELVLPHDKLKQSSAETSRRLIAYLIDLFIAFTVFVFVFFLTFSQISGIRGLDVMSIEAFLYENQHLFGIIEVGIDSVLLFYFAVFEWRSGQTIGKKVMGLRVEKMGFGQAVVRNITKAFFLTFPFLALFDIIWMLFSKDRRRLTEVLSRTKVLKQPMLRAEMSWQEL